MKQKTLKTKLIEDTEVLSLEESIRHHLENNMTVPPPEEWIPELIEICVQAVKAVNEHDIKREIPLSDGISITDYTHGIIRNYAWAWEVIVKFHLDQWLNPEWQ